MWIVVEGVDGAGKSTLIQGLKQTFPDSLDIREPGGTPFGEWVRGIVKGEPSQFAPPLTPQCIKLAKEFQTIGLAHIDKDFPREEQSFQNAMLLFLLARSELFWTKIQPQLQKSSPKTILQDRGMLSTYAYQAHDLHIKALLNKLEDGIWPNKPDVTFVLDLNPEISMQRLQKRNRAEQIEGDDFFERKGLVYFQRVRSIYLEQAKAAKSKIVVLDAEKDPDTILKDALQSF